MGRVNHGIVTEEIIKGIEAGAVWEPLDLGFTADDAVLREPQGAPGAPGRRREQFPVRYRE